MRPKNEIPSVVCTATVIAALLSGCVDPPLYEQIDKLRILAVRSDKPQLVFGETAIVDALVVTPTDAPLTLSWQLCAYVESADTKRACPKAALLQQATGATFSVSVTEALAASLEPLCTPDEAVLKQLPGGAALPECTDAGYPLIVRLTAKTRTETVVAVKKILAVSALSETRFENPRIIGFTHLPTSVHPGGTYTFTVEVDDASSLTTPGALQSDTAVSTLQYTWFVLGADAEYLVDHEIHDKPEEVHLKVESGQSRVSTWIVVRNATYGVDWRRLDFDVK